MKQRIQLTFHTPFNAFSFPFELVLPKKSGDREGKGCPVFVYLGFTPEPADGIGEEIVDYGYALAHINYQEIAPDKDDGFANGLGSFCRRNPFDGWGKIGMWAYGASRVMDYLLDEAKLDAKRIAVLGHSRLGKTALWCGALDERFSLVISNDSGGGGAALFRGKMGERIANLAGKGSGHWFCGNFLQYANQEQKLPFDQHFLLALTAPRHLYVASAALDDWADPHSELLSCLAAGPAYEICGVPGLILPEEIQKPEALLPDWGYHQGNIGYHIRSGTHHLGREDWRLVIEYRRRHGV